MLKNDVTFFSGSTKREPILNWKEQGPLNEAAREINARNFIITVRYFSELVRNSQESIVTIKISRL